MRKFWPNFFLKANWFCFISSMVFLGSESFLVIGQMLLNFMVIKITHPASNGIRHAYPPSRTSAKSTPTAHKSLCLVLLHSCPDTVHKFLLRGTPASTALKENCHAIYCPRQVSPLLKRISDTGHRYLPGCVRFYCMIYMGKCQCCRSKEPGAYLRGVCCLKEAKGPRACARLYFMIYRSEK